MRPRQIEWTVNVATLGQYIDDNHAWSVYPNHSNDRTAFGVRLRAQNR